MAAAVLVGLILAQAVSGDAADAAQVQRIRKALAQTPALQVERATDSTDRPTFRLVVRAPAPDTPAWHDWTTVPPYVHPAYPLYHYEFLSQVTPQQLRASTLYPGVDVLPLIKALIKGVRAEMRRREEARAREEVQQALADLARARAASIK